MTLTLPEQTLLAETAHSLRFPMSEDGTPNPTSVKPEMLLYPRRHEDRADNLWATFNRIQENTVKGMKTWHHGERVSSRAVKAIDGDVKLNRALWMLAEGMASLKKGTATLLNETPTSIITVA